MRRLNVYFDLIPDLVSINRNQFAVSFLAGSGLIH